MLKQPGIIPWYIDGTNAQVLFRELGESTIYNEPFLDRRLSLDNNEQLLPISINQLMMVSIEQSQPRDWIFHTSFCCSTLLARLLQSPERVLCLKEPIVLNQMAEAFRQTPSNEQMLTVMLNRIAQQLTKPFHTDQQAIIKTSNYMNALLTRVQSVNERSRVLLVWGGIEAFIHSMLKNRTEAEKTLPIFLKALSRDVSNSSHYVAGSDFWSDIAHVWAVQIQLFSEFIERSSVSIGVVSKDEITGQTERVISACDDFFDIEVQRDQSLMKQTLARDSKKQSYDPSKTNQKVSADFAQEIERTKALANSLIPDNALALLAQKALL